MKSIIKWLKRFFDVMVGNDDWDENGHYQGLDK